MNSRSVFCINDARVPGLLRLGRRLGGGTLLAALAFGCSGRAGTPLEGTEKAKGSASSDAAANSAAAANGVNGSNSAKTGNSASTASAVSKPNAAPGVELSEQAQKQLRALRYVDGPIAADPSNAYVNDARAQQLGQRLFFDASLSGPLIEGDNDGSAGTLGIKGESGKVSCASCHVPQEHFVDTRSPHRQISLAALWTKRRTPTLLEVVSAPLFNWDGRRDSIWGQALGVMESEREFNSSRLFIAQRVLTEYGAEYDELFGAAPALNNAAEYPQLSAADNGCTELMSQAGVSYACNGKPGDGGVYDQLSSSKQKSVTRVTVNAAKALAAYVSQLRCGPSRFDAWLDGDATALTESEQRGAVLFVGKAQCADCHSGSNLTDGKFHNVGLRPAVVAVAFTDNDDRGAAVGISELSQDALSTRGEFSDGERGVIPSQSDAKWEGAFRTPTLRCISGQPSFMHTGQLKSLESVVSFFSRGGDPAGGYPGVNELKRLSLSDGERADLVAFMGALAGKGPDAKLLLPLAGPTTQSTPPSSVSGEQNCGLESPAFCATFDEKPGKRGRSGELDPQLWSGARGMPSLHPDREHAFSVGPAYITDCRPEVNQQLLGPDQDALLCGATDKIGSPHLMIAAAAQNYGMTAYRIRQPFDFAERVGTISLDVNLQGSVLGGWPALALSEDPTPAPTFDFPERGSGPKNGVLVEFYAGVCNDPKSMQALVYTYADYQETAPPEDFDCDIPHVYTEPGELNHLTLRVGQGRLEVWATNALSSGKPQTPVLLYSKALQLPFSRGYLSLIARNHATIKYWQGGAWLTRWDNVGFDGPVIHDATEYSVADPLSVSHGSDGCTVEGKCVWRGEASSRGLDDKLVCAEGLKCDFDVLYHDAGYVIGGDTEEPLRLTIPGVKPTSTRRARLALAVDYPWFSWNDVFPPPTTFNLRYRLNGGAWHDRYVNEHELNAFAGTDGPGAGLLNQVIDVDVAELRAGDNALDLTLVGAWTGSYRAALLGVDLILTE